MKIGSLGDLGSKIPAKQNPGEAKSRREAKSGLDLPFPSHYSPHYVKECAAGRGWFCAGRRNGRPRRRDLSRLKQISTKTHGWQRSWVFWPLAATASHLKI
jgi:hypothetical protein